MKPEHCVLACDGTALRHPALRTALVHDLARLHERGFGWVVVCSESTGLALPAALGGATSLTGQLRSALGEVDEWSSDDAMQPEGEAQLRRVLAGGGVAVIRAISMAGIEGPRPVNAASLGAYLARHLHADRFFLMSDGAAPVVPGGRTAPQINDRTATAMAQTLSDSAARKVPLEVAAHAVAAGLRAAHLVDARRRHALGRELLGLGGAGITIVAHAADRFARDSQRYFTR